MLNQTLSPLPELAREGATTEIEIPLSDKLTWKTTVAEIVMQLGDGLADLQTDDYLRIEVLAVYARNARHEREQNAVKENPLYAGLMEYEA